MASLVSLHLFVRNYEARLASEALIGREMAPFAVCLFVCFNLENEFLLKEYKNILSKCCIIFVLIQG